MTISRRAFVKAGGLACAHLSLGPLVLGRGRPRRTLVVVYLRGGADGLALLVPHRDPLYYAARPSIAVPPRAVLDLDGHVGLPPALAPLLPLWRDGRLAAVPAVGATEPPRSHADARRAVERELPLLRTAPPTSDFASAMRRAARTVKAETAPPVIRVTLGGWDTHLDQGASQGRLAARLGLLASGLAGFAADLGPRLRDVVVVTWTEFGRAVQENAHGGTEHGGASAALVLGGGVRGGRVLGCWPALDAASGLAANRGVRDVMAELVAPHVDVRDVGRLAEPGAATYS